MFYYHTTISCAYELGWITYNHINLLKMCSKFLDLISSTGYEVC
jgi:hypothetical protein